MPKSKVGAALAAAYLLIVFLVSTPFLFEAIVNGSRGGLHSTSGMALFFTIVLTLPLSWPGMWVLDTYFGAASEAIKAFLMMCLLALSAVVNASVIYLFVSGIGRLFRSRSVNAHASDGRNA